MKQVKTMEYHLASTEFNVTIDFPNCIVEDPSWIGNGICDEISGYNTIQCGWDGGDCLIESYPDCHVRNPSKLGDGICQSLSNSEECGWDGGDCLEFNSKYPNCNVDYPWWIGNGDCDLTFSPDINTTECGYDGGDCLDSTANNDRSNELLWTLLILLGVFGFIGSVWDILRKGQRDTPIQQQNIEDTQLDRHTLVLASIIHKKVYGSQDKRDCEINDISEITSFPHESIISQRSSEILSSIDELSKKSQEDGIQGKDNVFVNISLRNDTSLEENSTRNDNSKICPICCEEYKKGDDISWSKNNECAHAFHTDCIVPWLMNHSDCPMCRNDYLCLESAV